MEEISKWLTHDDRKDLFEILVAGILNAVFLALVALLLRPPAKLTTAFRLAEGYALLWLVTFVVSALVNRLHRFFRVDIYTHADAYVVSNLVVSCFLQVTWAAFAALTIRALIADAAVWLTLLLYVVGVLSCLVAYVVVSAFFQGHVYKIISLPLALIGFIVFSVWPAVANFINDQFFNLF